MGSFLKVGKYRHINGRIDKRELWYADVNTSGSSASGTFIKANSKLIALNWQSNTGTIGLIPLRQFGKRKGDNILVHAHSSTISDFDFDPFHEFVLATGSEDTTLKIWNLKDALQEGKTTITEPVFTLSGHSKPIEALAFNPVAENILATISGDKTLKIWDCSSGQELKSFTFDNVLISLSWNYNGSLLFATGKDLKNRVIDPRSGESVQVGEGHQGVKPSRCVWLGNSPYVVTVGFSKMRERQLNLWDHRDLSKVKKTVTLDSSTGIINPIYDQDAQLLFISGNGDSTVRVFDLNTQFNPEPNFQELTPVGSDTPQKGLCALPKRALDIMEVEIDRLLKATANNIIPITFTLARKSKSSFAEDVFPNSASVKPALTTAEWLAGENRDPILMSLDPSLNPDRFDVDFKIASGQENTAQSAMSSIFFSESSPETSTTKTESEPVQSTPVVQPVTPVVQEPENITRTGIIPKIVRTSKYRHIVGTPFQKNQFHTNLKVSGNTSNTCIAVNSQYVAVPYIGIGGPLAVLPLSAVGRQVTVPCIEIGSSLCDFDLSQHNPSIVATGSEDSHIKIWKIPEGGLPKNGKNYFTYEADLIGHNRKIISTNFHPTAENVLITTGGDMVVKLWDLNQKSEKLSFQGHTDIITSISVNYTGDQFLTSSKDKKMRIFDPRSNQLISETTTHSGAKGGKSIWLGQNSTIFTVGFNKSSEREYQLWDSRNLNNYMSTAVLDHLSGVITPYFDEDTSVVFLAGKGDGTIRSYEINENEPYVHFLNEYSSGTPQIGVAQCQKQCVNVKKCEVARFYKVTDSTIEPIQMTIPRNRMEFFQDDIYPPTRSTKPVMTSDQWFAGETKAPTTVSLCPEGMVPLSKAPPPPKVETKQLGSVALDNGPTRSTIISKFLDKVRVQDTEPETTEDDDSEWD
ncbi:WD-40 repeat-containing protein [Tieghemostelium lacteum]|uniref:Coronin n=1 Tax=Tieghemostelium lacteum TaxID=361077 RepID=A0A151Z5Q3_TIELA|nr:WD-40 repeat-containing protein [Tieghemostelium lacteum]|eukprot:KYQ89281.1 WD-40 repeat-containing protein [Tieghemostelium lacteum]